MKNYLCGALALLLSGCASVPADQALDDARIWAGRAGAQAPALAVDASAREALQADRRRLLQGDLSEAAALQLALRSSPAAQALMAEGWALQSITAGSATWPRLGLAFERSRHDGESARATTLSIGLAELVTLPLRQASADRQREVQRLTLASELLALHGAVRQQWTRAVAAGQLLDYHRQVLEVAEAGDLLAQGMQKAGNFSLLQRSREQAFLVDAKAQVARATLQLSAEREALARLLGLNAEETTAVRWPERLPELPKAARARAEVLQAATRERLDIAIAQARWRAATGAQRTALLGSVDVEFEFTRETEGASVTRSRELGLSLALPDAALLRRQAADAGALAAAQRVEQVRAEATSTLRERHAAYTTAHELALQFRDELVPLRKTIADEMLLRYNGMLSGVFALLADARAQVGAVIGAIEAQRDFWLAQAALDAAILGAPSTAPALQASTPAAAESKGGH
jgi:outer membrane protein TolC